MTLSIGQGCQVRLEAICPLQLVSNICNGLTHFTLIKRHAPPSSPSSSSLPAPSLPLWHFETNYRGKGFPQPQSANLQSSLLLGGQGLRLLVFLLLLLPKTCGEQLTGSLGGLSFFSFLVFFSFLLFFSFFCFGALDEVELDSSASTALKRCSISSSSCKVSSSSARHLYCLYSSNAERCTEQKRMRKIHEKQWPLHGITA